MDIVFQKVVLHIDAEIKECPVCHGKNKGIFLADMQGALQYGAGIKAYLLSLLVVQMISLSRVQQPIKALIGMVISETTMLKYVLQLHRALEVWESRASQLLLQPAMHVDEISLWLEMENRWIHVYSAGEMTLKFFIRSVARRPLR